MTEALNTWISENAKKLIVGAFVVGIAAVPGLKLIGWVF